MSLPPRMRLLVGLTVAAVGFAGFLQMPALGFTQNQLDVAFRNIRSDDVPHNAEASCAWIYANRNDLTPQLVDELYRTDRQGRDVILYALIRTKSYQPDARFCQMLVSRLNEEDRVVGNDDLGLKDGVHWVAWTYMDNRYALFKPLLLTNLQTTNDMLCIWGTVTLLQKHGDLPEEMPKFSQLVWDTAALSLHSDNISYNAAQAARFYLLIGQDSLPHLQPLTSSTDFQQKNLAQATIDALGGSRHAYGYLNAHTTLPFNLFDRRTDNEPTWLADETNKWTGLDTEAYLPQP